MVYEDGSFTVEGSDKIVPPLPAGYPFDFNSWVEFIVGKWFNCPNCGAHNQRGECSYCGSPWYSTQDNW